MRTVGWMAFLAIVAVGCGDNETYIEETVPVSGTLTYQGKPLVGYTVLFMPLGGSRAASGVTDENGRFVLGTNDAGDGASVGKHSVAITYLPEIQGEPGKEEIGSAPPPPVKLPEKYGDPAKSGIEIEVPEEGLGNTEIKLD